MNKIGLFGGTFNPIHIGHAALASNVKHDFSLDKIILIPSSIPPHKNATGATPEQRYEMAALTAAFLGEGFEVSRYEIDHEGLSYTYLTLLHYRKKYPEAALFFIAGDDIFATINTWQNWRELFELTNFIVVDRDGTGFDSMLKILPEELQTRLIAHSLYKNEKYGKIIKYNMKPIDVSSTQVRIAKGMCNEMLLQEVYDYITSKKLYIGED